jgi:hypothetical protein
VVVKGALLNPREMLENRLGGVVNITRPDGLFPFPQAPMNPFVYQTINLLDQDKEQNSSVSKLGQGLNRDAISNQNSEGLVENLVGLGERRKKIIARNFANNFLIPLALEVYRLVLENEDRKKIIELAGNWVEVEPKAWKERKDCLCVLKLGYGEQSKEANKWLAYHKFMSSDPQLAPMYPPVQKFNVMKKVLEAEGVRDLQAVIAAPPAEMNKFEPPQPDPKFLAEVDELKARAEATRGKVQLATAEAQWQKTLDQMQTEFQKTQEMLKLVLSQREQERKEFDSQTKAEIAHRELDIIEATPASETKESHIVSPNS